MIKLTLRVNGTVYINVDNIRYFYANESMPGDTNIVIPNDSGKFSVPHLTVTESPDQVARLITEYKQRQMRLQAAYMALYKDTMGSYLEEEIIALLESEDRGE